MDLTRSELHDFAEFDERGFVLEQLPNTHLKDIALGRYELPRRTGEAHLYRLGHPLAEWLLQQAKNRSLPVARLVFDYDGYGSQISTLKNNHRGKSGWLSVSLFVVECFGNVEEHLIVSACQFDGSVLEEDDPEKLLRIPAHVLPATDFELKHTPLLNDIENRKSVLLRDINQRNLGYFDLEVEKLDAWADDLKLGLEQEIKEIDREIKEVRRTASGSPTLEEKLHWQKRQRELEAKRSKLRRELFVNQDKIEAERNELIEELEKQLEQKIQERTLFNIEWELI